MRDDAQHRSLQSQADETSETRASGMEGAVMVGGLIGALAASTCCLLPLVLALVGVGGAWMSSLRALAPFQPFFVAIAVAAIGYGFYRVYWSGGRSCEPDEACARPAPSGVVKQGLWLASAMVAVVVTFPYWFPLAEPYLP